MIYLIASSGLSLCTSTGERHHMPFQCYGAGLVPAWLQGRQNPHNLDGFCQVLSLACLVEGSWGNSFKSCSRSWLSFGSTLLPACCSRGSIFCTGLWILEENFGGLESGEGYESQGPSFGLSLGRTQSPALSLGCLGQSTSYLWCMELPGYKPCVALEGPFNLLHLPAYV